MGTAERKEREKELKRSMMLEAAEQLILEKGLDHLNMDEVAERAEVSKGSLYQYFSNKNDLVLGICNKATSILEKEIAKVLTKDLLGIELVYMIGATFLNFVNKHPEFFRAMRFHDNLKETNELSDSKYLCQCRDNMHSSFNCMVRAIQIGIQDGSINAGYDPKELAVILWGTSHGMVSLAYQHKNTEHFNLLEQIGIDVGSLFDGYMKLISTAISTNRDHLEFDFRSFFETNSE